MAAILGGVRFKLRARTLAIIAWLAALATLIPIWEDFGLKIIKRHIKKHLILSLIVFLLYMLFIYAFGAFIVVLLISFLVFLIVNSSFWIM